MTGVTYINPPGLRAGGAFSNLAVAEPGRFVFVAGQTAVDLDGNTVGPFDIVVQTHAVFKNIETALAAVGADFNSVCELTTYVVGIENRPAFQQARAEVFARIYPEGRYPPNTLLVISGLAKPEILIEISAIARLP